VAARYDAILDGLEAVEVPARVPWSDHVFHQYTIRLQGIDRDMVKERLQEKGIPSVVYYPMPLHEQEAMKDYVSVTTDCPVAEALAKTVLSLPIHTEMDEDEVAYIGQELVGAIRDIQK
jgi:dTDP-4-amino-4,6-dideoxygalactose transaminase